MTAFKGTPGPWVAHNMVHHDHGGQMTRPDPRLHRNAQLWQDWDDPIASRSQRAAEKLQGRLMLGFALGTLFWMLAHVAWAYAKGTLS